MLLIYVLLVQNVSMRNLIFKSHLFLTRLNHPVKKFKVTEPKTDPLERSQNKKMMSNLNYNYNGINYASRSLVSPPETIFIKQEPAESVSYSE